MFLGVCILTVLPNIVGGLDVSEPLGLGGLGEALGDGMSGLIYGVEAMPVSKTL